MSITPSSVEPVLTFESIVRGIGIRECRGAGVGGSDGDVELKVSCTEDVGVKVRGLGAFSFDMLHSMPLSLFFSSMLLRGGVDSCTTKRITKLSQMLGKPY